MRKRRLGTSTTAGGVLKKEDPVVMVLSGVFRTLCGLIKRRFRGVAEEWCWRAVAARWRACRGKRIDDGDGGRKRAYRGRKKAEKSGTGGIMVGGHPVGKGVTICFRKMGQSVIVVASPPLWVIIYFGFSDIADLGKCGNEEYEGLLTSNKTPGATASLVAPT